MLIIGKTAIRFNRTKQEWQAINGRIYSRRPPGDAGDVGKLAILIDAVTSESQEVAHLCRSAALRRPDLTREIWLAGTYVINQAVYVPGVAHFENQLAVIHDGEYNHHITLYDGCCTCGRADCEHAIAYLIQCQLWHRHSNGRIGEWK